MMISALNAYREIVEFDRSGKVEGHSRRPPMAGLELEELQNGALRFDVARAVSGVYMKRFDGAAAIARFDALLRGPGTGTSGWRDDSDADLQVIPRPGGSDTTIVVFCDFRHRFNMLLNTFYHVWLEPLPANFIILRDWERLLYLMGVTSMGNLKKTVAKLNTILEDLGTKKVITTGNSGGGFGALHYATLLDAKSCISFAPAVDVADLVTSTRKRTRTRLTTRLANFRDEGRLEWPEMPELYRQKPDVKAEIFFSEGNEFDRNHAETLKGIPNVKLTMLDGADAHGVLRQLAFDGRLEAVFEEAMK